MLSRSGTLRSWGLRGFGTVSVRHQDGKIENFFLAMHNVQWTELPEPVIGCVVHFDVDTARPISSGRYPLCLNARIYAPLPVTPGSAAAMAALSGAVPEASQSEGK